MGPIFANSPSPTKVKDQQPDAAAPAVTPAPAVSARALGRSTPPPADPTIVHKTLQGKR